MSDEICGGSGVERVPAGPGGLEGSPGISGGAPAPKPMGGDGEGGGNAAAPGARRLRKALIAAAAMLAAFALLPPLAIAAVRLYFSDARIKEMLRGIFAEELGIEAEMSDLSIGILSGSLRASGISLRNRSEAPSESFLRVELIEAETPVFAMIRNGFYPVSVRLKIVKPEVIAVRTVKDGREVTNLDAVIARFMAGSREEKPRGETVIPKMDISVEEAELTFKDLSRNLGQTRATDIGAKIFCDGPGKPVKGAVSFRFSTPRTPEGGKASVEFSLVPDLRPEVSPIGFARDISVSISAENLDLPYLARHAGIEGSLKGGAFKWTPGRPWSGGITLAGKDLGNLSAKAKLSTEELVSIWDKDRWVAGRIGGCVEASAEFGLAGSVVTVGKAVVRAAAREIAADAGKAPGTLETDGAGPAGTCRPGASGTGGGTLLDAEIEVGGGKIGGRIGDLPPVNASLRLDADRLFAADISRVLGIGGKFGGTIRTGIAARTFYGGDGTGAVTEAGGAALGSKAVLTAGRGLSVEGNVRAENARVEIEGKHQPVEVKAYVKADILLDGDGNPSSAMGIANVESEPLRVSTVEPFRVEGLAGSGGKSPTASGKIAFEIDGERLWREFGPVLETFSIRELKEKIAGEVSVSTTTEGTISLKASAGVEDRSGDAQPLTASLSASARIGKDGSAKAIFECRAGIASPGDFELSAAGEVESAADKFRLELAKASLRLRLAAARELRKRFDALCTGLPKVEEMPEAGEIEAKARAVVSAASALAAGGGGTSGGGGAGASAAGGSIGAMDISCLADVAIRGLKYSPPPSMPKKPAAVYDVAALVLKDLSLKGDGRAGTFELHFAAESDLSWRYAGAGGESPPGFLLKGEWKTAIEAPILIGTAVPGGAVLSVSGALIFDGAEIRFLDAQPYAYEKPAGVPCRLDLRASLGPDGSIRVAELSLKGGPAELVLEDLAYSAAQDGGKGGGDFSVSMKRFALDAPLSLQVADLALDTAADRLAFRMTSPPNDLARLNANLRFPKKFDIEGNLGPMDLSYDGRWSLIGGAPSATAPKGAGNAGGSASVRNGSGRDGGSISKAAVAAAAADDALKSRERPPTIGPTNICMRSGIEGSDDFHLLDIRFERADLYLADGRLSFAGLAIGKPPRFREKEPVRVGRVEIAAKLDPPTSGIIEIPAIAVEDTEVAFELNVAGTNIGRILAELDHFAAQISGPADARHGAVVGGTGKKSSTPVLIRKLKTSGLSLRISQSILKEGASLVPKKTLPPIELSDLRSDDILAAVPAVARCVLTPAIDSGRELALSIRDSLKASGEAIMKDLERKAAETTGAAKETERNIKDIGKELKDIFRQDGKKPDAKKSGDKKPGGEGEPKVPEGEKQAEERKAEAPASGKAGTGTDTEKDRKKKKRRD